jgi:hypothetical protein
VLATMATLNLLSPCSTLATFALPSTCSPASARSVVPCLAKCLSENRSLVREFFSLPRNAPRFCDVSVDPASNRSSVKAHPRPS